MTDVEIVRELAANFLITMFFVVVWATLGAEVTRLGGYARAAICGLFMGVAAVVSLLYTVDLGGGYVADLRSVPVAVAGLYAGPLGGLIAVSVTAAARLWIGGAGAFLGIVGITLSGCVGLAGYFYCRDKPPEIKALLFSLGLIVIPALPSLLLLPISQTLVTVSLFKFLGAFVSVYALELAHIRGKERRLLNAAIGVAPDYLYIKDPQSRLVAYSQAVADIYGSDRTGLIGKTDIELSPGERGRQLYADEQEILAQGRSLRGVIDWTTVDGEVRWFQSSKTMVTDADNKLIGLVGITRDITEDRIREQAVEDAAELWSLVLSQMADGVALFDRDCNFVFCNDQYHAMFPNTRDVRKPGASLREVLETALARGEQVRVPGMPPDQWVDAIVAGVINQEDEEVRLASGAYVQIRNREIPNLGYVSVAIDVTAMRETENDLAELTGRLAALAATDPLTGLANRRALDELFSREMARATRQKAWISAIMIDVDRFKSYNDLYGHGFGDSCLKLLAETMKGVAGRQTDIVARYGGEEFCLILPDTDETGAMAIAERLRQAVLDAAIPHEGSETGIVTISLGIAAYPPHQTVRTCEDLLVRADQALYAAKHAGRNQTVMGQMAA
jgi:diguanylate cyclase (GGDEF)-like protein/PAS domain S-box-containing protein